jgi:hypothetical protein
MSDRTETASI